MSDGQRLFIADGGNDRVLVYESIPTTNGANRPIFTSASRIEYTDQVTTSTDTFRPDANILESAPNTVRTPYGLAWDGTNLYVSDPLRCPRAGVHAGFAQYSRQRNYERGQPEYVRCRNGERHRNHHGGRYDNNHGHLADAATGTCHPPRTGFECYTYTVKSTDTLASIVDGSGEHD